MADKQGPGRAAPLLARGISVGAADRLLLCDVDLEAAAGEVLVIIGANGAGKSTLMRACAGIVPTNAGSIHLSGRVLAEVPREERARLLAFLPQHVPVTPGYRADEIVAMGQCDAEAGADALARCGVAEHATRDISTLSGGERQRVHLARALAQKTPLLLLDEPTAHLDIRAGYALAELLVAQTRARDLACVVIAHDLSWAAAIADSVVLLRDGRRLAAGRPDAVLRPDVLEEAFGVVIATGTDRGRRWFSPGPPPE